MPVIFEDILSVELCRENPYSLVVFGDNLARYGKKGQSIIRDEPNAVGIPTKRRPAYDDTAYFNDDDLDVFIKSASPVFRVLRDHLENDGVVIWPRAGIGTGLAELEQRAPRVWNCLQRAVVRLHAIETIRHARDTIPS